METKKKTRRVRPPVVMTLIHQKLKIVREGYLRITQEQMGLEGHLTQRVISSVESGRNLYIPNEYLTYFAKRGVNLNFIFDNDINSSDFYNMLLNGGAPKEVKAVIPQAECMLCPQKDKTIEILSRSISNMENQVEMTNKYISTLESIVKPTTGKTGD